MPRLRIRHLILGLMCAGASCRNQADGPTASTDPNTSATRSAPVTIAQLDGIDTSKLRPRERQLFSQYVHELMAPCKDVAVPVGQCVSEKRACKACVPAATFLLKEARGGKDKALVSELYRARFDPDAVKTIVLDGSPSKGPHDAPVVMVEFADFECGGCGGLHPVLVELMKTYGAHARLVFKHFPLDKHHNARFAAQAAVAAQQQSKFWAMHSILFEHQDSLSPPAIEGYAQELELDLRAFRDFAQSDEAKQRVERDLEQGKSLGIEGTPTLYINGRDLPLPLLSYDEVEAWIDLELELAGVDPTPLHAAAAASASAGPSAAPAPSAPAPSAAPSAHASGAAKGP